MSLPVLCVPLYAQATSEALRFIPVTPCRVLDTRLAPGPLGGPVMSGGSTREFPFLISPCSIPATAQAYSVNVTVVPQGSLGYLSIWPTGQAQPLVSTLNSLDGRIKANAAIVPAGANGSVSVFVTNTTDVVIDINGYFVSAAAMPSANGFVPVTPCRVMDTRGANGPLGGPFLSGGQLRVIPITASSCGAGGVAYSLNMTVVPRGQLGYLTSWPAGQSQPVVSTLNALTGAITANAAIVPAGDNGSISVFVTDDTDLVIDINGYFTPGAGLPFFTVTPCRALDTRNPPGPLGGPSLTGQRDFNISSSMCGIPASAQAQSLNATVVPQGSLGYLTLGPAGQPLPVVSTLNSLDGTIVSNAALVPAANGTITAFASNPTDLIVDVNGFFSPVGCTGDCPTPPMVQSATVGQNLQTPVLIQFPAGTTSVAVSSGDPGRLLVAARDTFAGAPSINLSIPFGITSVVVYVQALAGSGTVPLNATGSNGGTGSGTITLTPSGFVFIGPSGPVANFTSDQGVDTPIPISAARLDASLNFVAIQQVAAGLSVSVNPGSSNPAVGTITPVTFFGPADTVLARFTAVGQGSTTLTTGLPPSGFSTPNQNASVTATVNPASLSIDQTSLVIGQNLETDARVLLAGVAPPGGLAMSITSNDPSRLLLSTDPTAAGTASIQFVIPGGNRTTPTFYVQALGGSGNVTYTASASGFGGATQTLTLAPSGFVISGPLGFGNLVTTTGAANSNITVFASVLDGSLNFAAAQPLRGGFSASVPVTSSNPAVGTITTSPVTITGGSSGGITQFDPATVGTTTLTAGVPSGFATPANFRTLTATVNTPGLSITDGVSIGQNLQAAGVVVLGQPAPAGGMSVTLTSADASRLLLSSSATTAGSGTLTITVPEGTSNAQYFLQALGNSGTVNYTASASGFNQRTATVLLTPSGLMLTGPFGSSFTTTVGGGQTPLIVTAVQLDATNTPLTSQALRGGFSVNFSLTTAPAGVGTVQTPVTLPSGSEAAASSFTPVGVGSTQISLQQPANFGLSNRIAVQATVNP